MCDMCYTSVTAKRNSMCDMCYTSVTAKRNSMCDMCYTSVTAKRNSMCDDRRALSKPVQNVETVYVSFISKVRTLSFSNKRLPRSQRPRM